MPFVAGTPESLEASLQRRDSKDFSSTCHGINQNGTPCRTKISAKVSDGKEAYFCWRHKEQASALTQKKSKAWDGPGRRGSMDVLVEKVVAMTVTDEVKPSGSTAAATTVKTNQVKTTVHTPSGGGAYPFPPVPVIYEPAPAIPPLPPTSSHKHKVVSFLSGLFNRISTHSHKKRNPNPFSGDESSDEADDAPPTGQPQQYPPPYPQQPLSHSPPSLTALFKKKLLSKVRFDTTPLGPPLPHMVPESYPGGPPPQPPPSALSPPRKPNSHLPGYMSRRKLTTLIAQSKTAVIPPYLTGPTQKLLHETLTKPFSASDTPGYIYIFALLPSSPNRPPPMPTSSTIDPNDPTSQLAPRVLLKIGRTVNVASRLNQHANQCNYEPTLIRYYPHPDSKSVAKGEAVVHKVPNVNRIERLIHLELRDDPKVYPDELRHKCAVCGKIHKEWFSVEATEEGVKWVDGVVSRWIAWGEYWGGEGEGAKRSREEEEAMVRRGEKIARAAAEEDSEESGEEEIVVTGKVDNKTPPRRGRERGGSSSTPKSMGDALSPTAVKKTPRARSAAPAMVGGEKERPPSLKRGEGHRSVERGKVKPRSASASTPRPTPKSPAKSPRRRKVVEDDISDDYGEDSDASYHDAESGETEDEEDEVEWVEKGKLEVRSPDWRGAEGRRGSSGKKKAAGGKKK